MEVTQFTYFQQIGGLDCSLYRRNYIWSRKTGYVYTKESIFQLDWNDKGISYKDICFKNEVDQSFYNFNYADVKVLKVEFINAELEVKI